MTALPADAERLITGERTMAHLATSVNDRPHVAPVWYRYEAGVVEVTTTGRKLRNIRENPRVALSIQRDDDGETRWMVTLLGRATIVEDPEEKTDAVRRINEKYGVRPAAYETENTLVRIEIGSATHRTY